MRGNDFASCRTFSFFLLVHLTAAAFFPGLPYADTAGEVEQQPGGNSLAINGYISTKYVYRSASGLDGRVTDQDLFGEMRIDAGLPKDGKYEFHFFGAARDDLSDNRDRKTFNPLEDIGDTYQSAVHGYLYEAHLDVNRPMPYCSQVRVGRQAGTRDEPVFFDGAALDITPAAQLNLTLYGGSAVHLYEIANHWGDDTLAGAGLDYSPVSSAKLSLDYLSVKDEQTYPVAADLQDRMISLKLWQRLASVAKTSIRYRYLNGEPRDLNVRAVTAFRESDMEVNVNYFRLFRSQNELSNELSLYFDVLGRSSPYQSYDVKARKLFGPHYAVDIGYFKRALLENGETAFDRDFSRTFLLFELIDLPKDRMSFTLIAERWETTGREYNTAGLDAGYTFKQNKKSRVNLGTYYSLYKYDYYIQQGVSEKVRTYYVNGQVPFTRSLSVNGSVEFEDAIENYQVFKLGMRYDF